MSITVKTNLKVADFLGIHFEVFINHIKNRTTSLYKLIKILTIPQRFYPRYPSLYISSSKKIYDQNNSYYKDASKQRIR